jgi:hypothetical protein
MITTGTLSRPYRSPIQAQLDMIGKRFSGGCAVIHVDGKQHGRYAGTKTVGDTVYIMVARDGGGSVDPELPGYWQRSSL